MDKVKKYLKYALLIVVFYFFSNVLIFIGLNVNYKPIDAKGDIPSQVQVSQAEATLVNGRIRGTVKNDENGSLNGKYLKVDLYNSDNKLMGTKYLSINDLQSNNEDSFAVYFKAQDVKNYSMSITDTADLENKDLDVFITEDMKTYAIVGLLFAMIFVL